MFGMGGDEEADDFQGGHDQSPHDDAPQDPPYGDVPASTFFADAFGPQSPPAQLDDVDDAAPIPTFDPFSGDNMNGTTYAGSNNALNGVDSQASTLGQPQNDAADVSIFQDQGFNADNFYIQEDWLNPEATGDEKLFEKLFQQTEAPLEAQGTDEASQFDFAVSGLALDANYNAEATSAFMGEQPAEAAQQNINNQQNEYSAGAPNFTASPNFNVEEHFTAGIASSSVMAQPADPFQQYDRPTTLTSYPMPPAQPQTRSYYNFGAALPLFPPTPNANTTIGSWSFEQQYPTQSTGTPTASTIHYTGTPFPQAPFSDFHPQPAFEASQLPSSNRAPTDLLIQAEPQYPSPKPSAAKNKTVDNITSSPPSIGEAFPESNPVPESELDSGKSSEGDSEGSTLPRAATSTPATTGGAETATMSDSDESARDATKTIADDQPTQQEGQPTVPDKDSDEDSGDADSEASADNQSIQQQAQPAVSKNVSNGTSGNTNSEANADDQPTRQEEQPTMPNNASNGKSGGANSGVNTNNQSGQRAQRRTTQKTTTHLGKQDVPMQHLDASKLLINNNNQARSKAITLRALNVPNDDRNEVLANPQKWVPFITDALNAGFLEKPKNHENLSKERLTEWTRWQKEHKIKTWGIINKHNTEDQAQFVQACAYLFYTMVCEIHDPALGLQEVSKTIHGSPALNLKCSERIVKATEALRKLAIIRYDFVKQERLHALAASPEGFVVRKVQNMWLNYDRKVAKQTYRKQQANGDGAAVGKSRGKKRSATEMMDDENDEVAVQDAVEEDSEKGDEAAVEATVEGDFEEVEEDATAAMVPKEESDEDAVQGAVEGGFEEDSENQENAAEPKPKGTKRKATEAEQDNDDDNDAPDHKKLKTTSTDESSDEVMEDFDEGADGDDEKSSSKGESEASKRTESPDL